MALRIFRLPGPRHAGVGRPIYLMWLALIEASHNYPSRLRVASKIVRNNVAAED